MGLIYYLNNHYFVVWEVVPRCRMLDFLHTHRFRTRHCCCSNLHQTVDIQVYGQLKNYFKVLLQVTCKASGL